MKRELYIATLLVAANAVSALAQIKPVNNTFTLTDLHPANVSSQWDSLARAIDNTGRAVGDSRNAAARDDAFQTLPNAPFISGTSDDLGLLGGDVTSQAWAINKNGLIVGLSMSGTGSQRAFLFTPGSGLTNLNTTGSLGSLVISNAASIAAFGINDFGWIVGSFTTDGEDPKSFNAHSFLSFGPGSTQVLDSHFGSPAFSAANDVNNNGQIVGFLRHTASEQPQAYLFDTSSQHLTLIGALPGGSMSIALAVNDSGKVVGNSLTPPPNGVVAARSQHAFAFQDLNHNGVVDSGELIDLDPGDVTSGATAVNSSGTVVGYYGDLDFVNAGSSRAAIFANGRRTDLNTLVPAGTGGWTLRAAYGINDAGQIVGFMQNAAGVVHAFRLDPIVQRRL